MKLIITEQQFNKLLIMESIENSLNTLLNYGFKIVDKYISNNYTMFLLTLQDTDFYQIALTSNDDDFIDYDSQVKKYSLNSNDIIRKSYRELGNKVKSWVNVYGTIYVGSFNIERTYKYKKLLQNLGLKTSAIHHDESDNQFPESWSFTITI